MNKTDINHEIFLCVSIQTTFFKTWWANFAKVELTKVITQPFKMTRKFEIFHILLIGGWIFFFSALFSAQKKVCVSFKKTLKLHDGHLSRKNGEFLSWKCCTKMGTFWLKGPEKLWLSVHQRIARRQNSWIEISGCRVLYWRTTYKSNFTYNYLPWW